MGYGTCTSVPVANSSLCCETNCIWLEVEDIFDIYEDMSYNPSCDENRNKCSIDIFYSFMHDSYKARVNQD